MENPSSSPTAEASRTEDPTIDSPAAPDAAPAIASEMLIEEISIDGMCGVY